MLANFDGKEHLRHRAVSLRQHGFLVELKNGFQKNIEKLCIKVTSPQTFYHFQYRVNERYCYVRYVTDRQIQQKTHLCGCNVFDDII